MTFAMADKPGEFTSFEFPPGVPAPFNMAAAILTNTEMLSLVEKIRMVPGLLPMLLEGQSFIDKQDELSVLEFMRKYGMPERINEEIFIAMGKALVATGMAQYLAAGFVSAAGDLPTPAIISAFILIMAVLTNIVSNNAAAVIGTPIAIAAAQQQDAKVKSVNADEHYESSASDENLL